MRSLVWLLVVLALCLSAHAASVTFLHGVENSEPLTFIIDGNALPPVTQYNSSNTQALAIGQHVTIVQASNMSILVFNFTVPAQDSVVVVAVFGNASEAASPLSYAVVSEADVPAPSASSQVPVRVLNAVTGAPQVQLALAGVNTSLAYASQQDFTVAAQLLRVDVDAHTSCCHAVYAGTSQLLVLLGAAPATLFLSLTTMAEVPFFALVRVGRFTAGLDHLTVSLNGVSFAGLSPGQVSTYAEVRAGPLIVELANAMSADAFVLEHGATYSFTLSGSNNTQSLFSDTPVKPASYVTSSSRIINLHESDEALTFQFDATVSSSWRTVPVAYQTATKYYTGIAMDTYQIWVQGTEQTAGMVSLRPSQASTIFVYGNFSSAVVVDDTYVGVSTSYFRFVHAHSDRDDMVLLVNNKVHVKDLDQYTASPYQKYTWNATDHSVEVAFVVHRYGSKSHIIANLTTSFESFVNYTIVLVGNLHNHSELIVVEDQLYAVEDSAKARIFNAYQATLLPVETTFGNYTPADWASVEYAHATTYDFVPTGEQKLVLRSPPGSEAVLAKAKVQFDKHAVFTLFYFGEARTPEVLLVQDYPPLGANFGLSELHLGLILGGGIVAVVLILVIIMFAVRKRQGDYELLS